VGVDGCAPCFFAGIGLHLDVGDGIGFSAGAEGVFAVGGDFDLGAACGGECADEGGDGAIAFAGEVEAASISGDGGAAAEDSAGAVGMEMFEGEWGISFDVFFPEDLAQFGGGDFAAECVDGIVCDGTELALHLFWQFDAELAFEEVGDSTFARLAVDADDLMVFAAEVAGIDGEVRDVPDTRAVVTGPLGEPFADGVLVGSGESGEDEFAGVGVAWRDGHAGTALVDFDDRGEV